MFCIHIDTIGCILTEYDLSRANESFDVYKELSERNVGMFAGKNIYLMDKSNDDKILKKYEVTSHDKMFHGGTMSDMAEKYEDVISRFMAEKDIPNDLLDDANMRVMKSEKGRVLLIKRNMGFVPFLEKSNGQTIFHKLNLNENQLGIIEPMVKE